jgi:hypothetical protein
MHAKRTMQKDNGAVRVVARTCCASQPGLTNGFRQVIDLRGLLWIGFLSQAIAIFSLAARARS